MLRAQPSSLQTIVFDPASFRDPSGRLFRQNGSIYRTCSPAALSSFQRARDEGLIDALTRAGLLVPSTLVQSVDEGLDATSIGAQVIKQPELPFVSYSYEWSFTMLRDAALTTLRALELCLDRGFVLKDATAFNVLFEGSAPRLVDVHSLEPRVEGALWAGYAQFCRAFLFPLLLFSYRAMDPRPLLLANLGEVPVQEIGRLFGWRDVLKPGVFVNVSMQQQLERRFAGKAEDVGKAGAGVKYPLPALRSQVRKLHAVIEGLASPRGDAWTTYVETHTYDDEDVKSKEAFVREAVAKRAPRVVIDLGTNTGQYSRLARAEGPRVVAVDLSSACVDAVYRQARGDTGLSPVVSDLTRPTPAIGWRLVERRSLLDRLKGDVVLALALIHHLRITGGIPLAEVVDLLTSMAPSGVIEWVGREDPMVKRLLALRPDVYDDYTRDRFEQMLATRGRIAAVAATGSDRAMYAFERE
jgi:SAM-dependent methyltransferase